jgi:hypothetical protein
MGVAVIGGLISSTLLTLVVVPAVFSYVDRFRLWSGSLLARLVSGKAIPSDDLEIIPATAIGDEPSRLKVD